MKGLLTLTRNEQTWSWVGNTTVANGSVENVL